MKPIINNELKRTFEDRKLFLSKKKATHPDEFDELAKLVAEQTGHAPKANEGYVFMVEGNSNIKILIQEGGEPLMCELTGEQATRMTRACMETIN